MFKTKKTALCLCLNSHQLPFVMLIATLARPAYLHNKLHELSKWIIHRYCVNFDSATSKPKSVSVNGKWNSFEPQDVYHPFMSNRFFFNPFVIIRDKIKKKKNHWNVWSGKVVIASIESSLLFFQYFQSLTWSVL